MTLRKLLLAATAAFLTVPFASNAICTGCTYAGPIIDDPAYLYHWEARVKYQYWYYNQQGQHTMRWNYADISGDTQSSCEYQLNSWAGSGAQVVEFCTRVRNF
ncbi:MAG: hypothetical protein R3E90_12150 [Marinicella sp.]|nr:hypothetical protein [Xanthomonadales bacterium]